MALIFFLNIVFSSDQSSGCTNQSYIVDNGWY
jgi:hypothetical protein